MDFTLNMHDANFNLNSLSCVFARYGNSNNINNLQIDSSKEESLKNANSDEATLFEMHMEKLKKKGTT
jgi:hypothetical protein